MRTPLLFLIATVVLFTLTRPANAGWEPDGATVCTAINSQVDPMIVPDGAGGAFIVWQDYRFTLADVFVQRVNAYGVPQWTAGGVAVCVAANNQLAPMIAADGAGGAIMTWIDHRAGGQADVYAQRVDAAGVPLWAANGVPVCVLAGEQYRPVITGDGAGGAIIAWWDTRVPGNLDIYAQRVSALGVPQWTANGVALCTATGDQDNPMIASDGAGGAVVTWDDERSVANNDIYAQRVNASGVPQWAANGVAVCTAAGVQVSPIIVPDGAGGVLLAWWDFRFGVAFDIFAQKLNAAGVAQWPANGVAVCSAANNQSGPGVVSDGAGGAIVTWFDFRNGSHNDIYAQRVTVAGDPLWAANGVAVCATAGSQANPIPTPDGLGGIIVTWQDSRNGGNDIFAQRMNGSGVAQWTANGVAVCTMSGEQYEPMIVADGAGGAIITWNDYRGGLADIYAQRVETYYGTWGRPEPQIISASDNPADQGGKVIVRWNASQRDQRVTPLISHYSLWRATDVVLSSSALVVQDPREIEAGFSGKAFLEVTTTNGPAFWEWIANQNATYQETYSLIAPTRQDSVASNAAIHYFKVLAHDASTPETPIWESGTVSSYSVDNLAPPAPLFLVAQRIGADVQLRWNRVRVPDLRDYSVYRATATGVTPVPVHFLSTSDDTVLVDNAAPNSTLYYIVTAYDVHNNQGIASNEASVGSTTGAGNTPALTSLSVQQNHPNPFNGSTQLEIGLPARSDIAVEIYDVAGRRVGAIEVTGAAGWNRVAFNGRDASGRLLPSGVYFYRVQANGETLTRKMVITR